MASEYMGQLPDPDKKNPTQKSPTANDVQPDASPVPDAMHAEPIIEPVYREHVSRPLAPYYQHYQQPASVYDRPQRAGSSHPPYYPPYNGQPYYPPQYRPANGQYAYAGTYIPAQQYAIPAGYQQQQPGYQSAPYIYQPRPKRDTYLLTISIIAFIASIFVLVGGLFCALITILVFVGPHSPSTSASQLFSGSVLFIALSIAALVGGGFSMYHSMRALFWKIPSRHFSLPRFWIFLGLYIVLIAIGFLLRGNQQVFSNQFLTITLIMFAGILPALTVYALVSRRLSVYRGEKVQITTWRRVTLALVSGATSAIIFASVLELFLTAFVALGLHLNNFSLADSNAQTPQDARSIIALFLIASVVAPLVEEGVKPLAVVTLIGRINSAAEAFMLGMACGIGFDLIETSGYISQGYRDWLGVALERSTAGLLHGFGAGMVALGWYLLTHKQAAKRHILLGMACGTYAVLQHAIWNGSFLFALLPAPLGPFLNSGVIPIGSYAMPAFLFVYIVESILMIVFLLYVTGKLRRSGAGKTPTPRQPSEQSSQAQQSTVQTQFPVRV